MAAKTAVIKSLEAIIFQEVWKHEAVQILT